METITSASTYPSPSDTFDIMGNTQQPQYLKMEDIHTTSSPSPDSHDPAADTQASPPPVIIHSKPAKKRKSWGQELPEPKTTLPPRKRAKTDDEKEQRRIERIKRNRAAAHNSRERKRQEAEHLAVLLAHANAKLDAYRKLHGPLPDNVVLPEVTLCNDEDSTPAPSLGPSRGSFDATISPPSPAETVTSSHPAIKQEPIDLPTTISPPVFESLDPKSGPLPQLDATQHSAAMLCDLQCPSSPCPSSQKPTPTSSSLSSTSQASWRMTQLFLQLLMLHLSTCYAQILLALWAHSPSRMARMIQASTIRLAIAARSRSTTSSTRMPYPSRSTRPLAQLKAATGLASREGAHAALVRQSSATLSKVGRDAAVTSGRRSSVSSALQAEAESGNQGEDGVGG